MTDSIMTELSERYRVNQESLLELVSGLTNEQIAWTPNETTPSVGFHVWHLARWADYLQELFNGRGSQLWEAEGLAARWNMETKSLGYAQTGMEMDEKSAMALRMPEKDLLLDLRAAHLPPRSKPWQGSRRMSSLMCMNVFTEKTGMTVTLGRS